MSSSYFCCSSWTPSSLWTRRTPPVSKVLWWYSCIHTPLGVYIDLKKQGAPHQKCLNKCKHMYLIFREMSHTVQLLSSPMIRWMLRKMMKRASDPIQNSLALSKPDVVAHCFPASIFRSVLPPQPTQSSTMPTNSLTGVEGIRIWFWKHCQTLTQTINRTAIVDTWRSYTYGELHSYAAAIASSLQGRRGAR